MFNIEHYKSRWAGLTWLERLSLFSISSAFMKVLTLGTINAWQLPRKKRILSRLFFNGWTMGLSALPSTVVSLSIRELGKNNLPHYLGFINILAGGAAGLILTPFELISAVNLARNTKSKPWEGFLNILNANALRGFWRGASLVSFREATWLWIYTYGVPELSKKMTSRGTYQPVSDIASAALLGGSYGLMSPMLTQMTLHAFENGDKPYLKKPYGFIALSIWRQSKRTILTQAPIKGLAYALMAYGMNSVLNQLNLGDKASVINKP